MLILRLEDGYTKSGIDSDIPLLYRIRKVLCPIFVD